MIKGRLEWYIEKNSLLPNFLSGFRKGRSTTDNIVLLENDIQKTINCCEHMVAVFLDVEKGYDSLWIEGLLYKIEQCGINGNMLKYLHNLFNRTYF